MGSVETKISSLSSVDSNYFYSLLESIVQTKTCIVVCVIKNEGTKIKESWKVVQICVSSLSRTSTTLAFLALFFIRVEVVELFPLFLTLEDKNKDK